MEDNPAVLFEALSGIKNHFDTVAVQVSDEELIATVFDRISSRMNRNPIHGMSPYCTY